MKRFITRGILMLALAGLTACGSAPMQFYMLNANTGLSAGSAGGLPQGTVIGLGPIRLPAYLDRPQLVTALSEHQYQLDERNRWAERLDENIGRALTESLAGQLGVEQIVRHPWASRQRVDYQISFDILALHQTAGGQSRLSAQWQLKKAEHVLLSKRFECAEPAGEATEAIVAAQSRCLTRFSMELAGAVRRAADGGISP